MRLRGTLFCSFAVGTVAACAAGSGTEDTGSTVSDLTSGGATARLSITSNGGDGYCADVQITDTGATPITSFSVQIKLNQSVLSTAWKAAYTRSGGSLYTFTPVPSDATIAAGAS